MELTPELVRIHAHLCGDGTLCQYAPKSDGSRHRRRAEILYFNSNPALIAEFRRDMFRQFGVRMRHDLKQQKAVVKSLRIARELLMLSDYKSHTWRIPNVIKTARREFRAEWLKAYAHDDGCTPEGRNTIRIRSVNRTGLIDAKELADSMGIRNTLTGPYRDGTCYLNIWKEQEFAGFIKVPSRK